MSSKIDVRETSSVEYESKDKVTPPPELDLTIIALKDIGNVRAQWSSREIQSQIPTNILLITVDEHEFRSCYSYMKKVQRSYNNNLGMVDFGEFGEENVPVALIRSQSRAIKAALAVKNAVEILGAKVALFVGYCSSLNPAKAKLGDVLISAELVTYSSTNITAEGSQEWHGVKTNISPNLASLILSARDGWKPPLKNSQSKEVKVHCKAVILSGPETINDPARREELLKSFPDAIGLEKEGEGLYEAARDLGIEWAVIRGVSDFADGNKAAKNEWQLFASAMAASVVYNMFKHPDVLQHWPRCQKPVTRTTVPYGLRFLPRDMVERRSEVDDILSLLKMGKNNVCVVGVPSSNIIGIRGMGGIGKTVLAQAIAWSESKAREVIWLDFGQTPYCLALINTLVKALGGSVSFNTLTEAKDWVQNTTIDKDGLIILDDVWNVDDANAFDCLSGNCQLLITTRDASVVRGLKVSAVYELQIMPQKESRALLYRSAQVTDVERSTFTPNMLMIIKELLEECRGLPLALSLVGSYLVDSREEQTWQDMLDDLKSADFTNRQSLFPEDAYPYGNLFAAMDASFKRLKPIEQEKFLDFAIFPEDIDIPSDILQLFWSLQGSGRSPCSERDGRRLLTELERKSLIQKGSPTLQGKNSYRVHDLLLDFARGELGKSMLDVKRIFLDALRRHCDNGKWPKFRGNRDYYFEYLPYHMHSAEQYDELLDLMFDFHWLEQKVKLTSIPSLIIDFCYLDTSSHEVKLLKSSLMLSAEFIEKSPDSIGVQLLGRLESYKDESQRVKYLVELARETCTKRLYLLPISPCLTEPVGPLIKTMTMDCEVLALATFTSSAGTNVISGLEDGTIKIHDLETGRELQRIEGHTKAINSLALSHSGTMLVSGSDDHSARLWSMDSGELQFVLLHPHVVDITKVCFSADDQRLFTAYQGGELSAWSVVTGELLKTIAAHNKWINDLCTTEDGLNIATASDDATIKLWHADTLNFEATFPGHRSWVLGVVATSDSQNFVSASADGTLKIIDRQTFEEIRIFRDDEHEYCEMLNVAVSKDLKHIISGGDDCIVRLWCFESRKLLFRFRGHWDDISCVTIISNGTKALSGSRDGSIRVWDLDESAYLKKDRTCRHKNVYDIKISRDGSTCVSSSNEIMKIWDCATGELRFTYEDFYGTCEAISPNGLHFVLECFRWIEVYKLADAEEMTAMESVNGFGEISLVRFTPNGQLIVFVCDDNCMFIWDWKNSRVPTAVELAAMTTMPVNIACDNNVIYTCSIYNEVCKIELDSQKISRISQGPFWSLPAVILPDGKRVLFVSDDSGSLVIYSSSSSRVIDELETGHPQGSHITAIDIASDGKLAVSGTSSGTISVVNLESRNVDQTFADTQSGAGIRLISVLRNDDASFVIVDEANRVKLRNSSNNDAQVVLCQPNVKVTCVAPLGLKYFLLGCENGEILLFDYLENIRLVNRQQAHDEAISQIKSHPNNESLSFVSGSVNGSVKRWLVKEADIPVYCQLWSRDNVCRLPITALAFVPNSEEIVYASCESSGVYRVNDFRILLAYHCKKTWRSDTINVLARVVNDALVAIYFQPRELVMVKFSLDDAKVLATYSFNFIWSIQHNLLRVDLESKRVVSRGEHRFMFLWNLNTGRIICRLCGNARDIQAVTFVPGRKFLLCRYIDKNILDLCDVQTGRVVETFHFESYVRALACASNGTVSVGLYSGKICFLRLNNLSSHSEQLAIEV